MGRKVSFKIQGDLLESEIVKVDRTKIYGSSEKIVLDTNKEECVLSDLYEGVNYSSKRISWSSFNR